MLKAFLHTFCKSKFLEACTQPYNFFHISLYKSLKVDIVFFYIQNLVHVFFVRHIEQSLSQIRPSCRKSYFKISPIKIPFWDLKDLHNILEPTTRVTLFNNGFNSNLKVSTLYNIGHNKCKELPPTKLQFNP